MDIKDFIVEAVTQIAQGVSELKEKNDELGIIVNPNIQVGEGTKWYVPQKKSSFHMDRQVQDVGFEISVTVVNEQNGGGKAGLSIAGFLEVGAGAGNRNAEENVNKLKFTIPVCLPTTILNDDTEYSNNDGL